MGMGEWGEHTADQSFTSINDAKLAGPQHLVCEDLVDRADILLGKEEST